MKSLLSFIALLFVGAGAMAQTPFTYTGRLMTSDGTTAATGVQTFMVTVNTDVTCPIYRRTYLAPVDADGKFSFALADAASSPPQASDFGTGIQNLLESTGIPANLDCDADGNAVVDGSRSRSTARSLLVYILDGGSWELIDTQAISAAFEAVNAQYLRGYVPGNSTGNLVVIGAGNQIPIALIPTLTTAQLPSFNTMLGSSTIGIDRGGTGATTAVGALTNLLPTQTGFSSAYLMTDGTNVTWGTVAAGGSVTSVTAGTGLSGGVITNAGTISLATSGVTAGSYGSSSAVANFTVDTYGRLAAAASTPIAINASQISGGTIAQALLPIYGAASNYSSDLYIPSLAIDAYGRLSITGSTAISMPAAGILGLSGDVTTSASSGTVVATIAMGAVDSSKILDGSITNLDISGTAAISDSKLAQIVSSGKVANSATSASVTAAADTIALRDGFGGLTVGTLSAQTIFANTLSAAYLNGTLNLAGSGIPSCAAGTALSNNGTVWSCVSVSTGGISSVTAGAGLDGGVINSVGTISLGTSGVSAGSYGGPSWIPNFVVDAFGRLTSVGSMHISIDANQISSGTLDLARVGNIPVSAVSGNLPFTQLNGTISTAQLGNVDANSIVSGTLAYARIGSIAGSMIGSGTIDLARLGNLPASQVSGNLPFTQLSGTISTAQLGNIDGSAITSIAGSSITSGTIDLARIGNIPVALVSGNLPFTQLSGTISTAQLGGVDASSIASGTLAYARIGSIAGSMIGSGTIDLARLGNLPASQLSGSLPFAQLSGTINTAQLGNIDGSAITSIAGSSITSGTIDLARLGNLPASQVSGNLPFTQLSGTISTAQLANIDANSIASGTLAYARIGSIAGSMIGSGTIDLARLGNLPASQLSGSLPFTQLNGTISSAQLGTIAMSQVSGSLGFSSLYGTISIAQLGTIDGSVITNIAGTSITSGTINWARLGSFPASQMVGNLPFTQLSGTISTAQLGNIDANSIVSGTLAYARIGSIAGSMIGSGTIDLARLGNLPASQVSGSLPFTQLSGTINTSQVGSLDASVIGAGTLSWARLGTHPASMIASGTLDLARIGTLPFTQLGGTMNTAQLGVSGVAAGSYGISGYFPTFSVDTYGRLTSVGSQGISLNGLSGTIGAANGGTGLNASSAVNGALLVGNGSGFSLSNLNSSNGIVVNNQVGTIALSTNGTSGNVANTLVYRNSTGGFSAGTIGVQTLSLVGAGTVSLNAPAGNYAMNFPPSMGTPGQFLMTNGTSNLSWASMNSVLGIPGSGYPILFGSNGTISTATGFVYDPTISTMALNGSLEVANFIGIGTYGTITSGTRLEVKGGAVRAGPRGIASTEGGEMQFAEIPGNGTNSVAFRAPDSIINNVTWTLPSTDGTFGQALVTNGTGALSWTTAPGFVFPMVSTTKGSQNIAAYTFSSDGDTGIYSPGAGTLAFATDGTTRLSISTIGVGIGTMGPLSLFHVNGTASVQSGSTFGSRFTQTTEYSSSATGVNATALFTNYLTSGGAGTGGTLSSILAQAVDTRTAGSIFGAIIGVYGNSMGSGNINVTDIIGVKGQAEVTNGVAGNLTGVQGRVYHNGTNNVPNAFGIYSTVEDSPASGTIINAYGVYVGSLGVATNAYGLYIGTLAVSSVKYSIYASDPTSRSYLGGSVGVGIQLPTERLDVFGGIRSLGTTGDAGFIRLSGATGTASVGFRAPNIVANNLLWTLPAADGTPGYMLTTTGTGTLAWAAPSGGGSQWTTSGSNIYFATGSITLGSNASPRGAFEVTNGAVVGPPSGSLGALIVDFSRGNIQHTPQNCGAFSLYNLKDGGAYTFIVKGDVSTTCSFTAFSGSGSGPLTVHLPPNLGPTIATKDTLFSISVSESDVYILWTPGL